jgi:lysozyme family protein
MADFEIAFDETMIREGGYVNDPDDRGGETYRGISRVFHGSWAGWQTIDRTRAKDPDDFESDLDSDPELDRLVKKFYRENFWNVLHGDEITDQHLANELFDTGVNQGSGTAIRYWQESLNLLNRNERDYADIEVDGKVGNQTLSATASFIERNGSTESLLKVLNLLQGMHYIEKCQKTPSQRKFMFGWLKRVRI